MREYSHASFGGAGAGAGAGASDGADRSGGYGSNRRNDGGRSRSFATAYPWSPKVSRRDNFRDDRYRDRDRDRAGGAARRSDRSRSPRRGGDKWIITEADFSRFLRYEKLPAAYFRVFELLLCGDFGAAEIELASAKMQKLPDFHISTVRTILLFCEQFFNQLIDQLIERGTLGDADLAQLNELNEWLDIAQFHLHELVSSISRHNEGGTVSEMSSEINRLQWLILSQKSYSLKTTARYSRDVKSLSAAAHFYMECYDVLSDPSVSAPGISERETKFDFLTYFFVPALEERMLSLYPTYEGGSRDELYKFLKDIVLGDGRFLFVNDDEFKMSNLNTRCNLAKSRWVIISCLNVLSYHCNGGSLQSRAWQSEREELMLHANRVHRDVCHAGEKLESWCVGAFNAFQRSMAMDASKPPQQITSSKQMRVRQKDKAGSSATPSYRAGLSSSGLFVQKAPGRSRDGWRTGGEYSATRFGRRR